MRETTLSAATAAIVMAALLATGAWAAGGSTAASVPVPDNPEQQAADHYNRALKYRDKAWELEKEAAGASGEEAEKLAKKVTKQYQKAATALRSAIGANPEMYQAHGSLGYALRKLEKYDEALEAYDQALALNPGYSEAIEYRAEAYLGLNRLEDVMGSYLELFKTDQARAGELMAAMQAWLAGEAGSSLEPDRVEAFAAWVAERAEIAQQIGSGASGSSW